MCSTAPFHRSPSRKKQRPSRCHVESRESRVEGAESGGTFTTITRLASERTCRAAALWQQVGTENPPARSEHSLSRQTGEGRGEGCSPLPTINHPLSAFPGLPISSQIPITRPAPAVPHKRSRRKRRVPRNLGIAQLHSPADAASLWRRHNRGRGERLRPNPLSPGRRGCGGTGAHRSCRSSPFARVDNPAARLPLS